MISYASRTLNVAEFNNYITKKTMRNSDSRFYSWKVLFLLDWDIDYIIYRSFYFKISIDQERCKARFIWWILLFSEFDLETLYRKDIDNQIGENLFCQSNAPSITHTINKSFPDNQFLTLYNISKFILLVSFFWVWTCQIKLTEG